MVRDILNTCSLPRCSLLSGLLLGLSLVTPTVQATETVTYYYTNEQGTPLATADAIGDILSTSDYRPYGGQVLGSPATGPGYTGHVNDPDSGLVYMQARYYDPVVGRFLSADPDSTKAGAIESFARFSYASDNPIGSVDPNGKQSWCTPGNCGAQEYLAASHEATYIKDNFDLVGEAKGAAALGLGVTYNISSNKGEINLFPAAEGAELSLFFQAKHPLVLPFVSHPTDAAMAIGWGAGADLALGFKFGFDIKFNPGGTFEFTPKAGFGVGEFQQYAPAITLFQWGSSESNNGGKSQTSEQIHSSQDWSPDGRSYHPGMDQENDPNRTFAL